MSGESWKEFAIQHKYAEIPEEPRYVKKKKPKRVVRSDHKHNYVSCYFNSNITVYRDKKRIPVYGCGMYCSICGRIGDTGWNQIPVEDADPNIPVFNRGLLDLNKYVSI